MQSLPAPSWRLGRRAPRGRRAGLAVAALGVAGVIALVLAGVLAFTADDSRPLAPGAAHAARPAPEVALINGHPLQSADCADWSMGSGAQRSAILAALARDVGGATGFGPATTLRAADAQDLFTRGCASPIAQHWLLYELYIRAAGLGTYR